MYYYGARYYDPRISIFVSVDPLAEQTMTPYQYVSNNPIMRIDPTGMNDHDYKRNSETGEISLIRKTNDTHDRILNTDKDGNVKIKGEGFLGFLVSESEKGKEKVLLDNIPTGILKDGINFENNYNVVPVNGVNEDGTSQPSDYDFQDFIQRYSGMVRKEVSGYGLGNSKHSDIVSAYLVEPHKGNAYDASNSIRLDKNIAVPEDYLGGYKGTNIFTKIHYHTHPDDHGPSPDDKIYAGKKNVLHYIYGKTNNTHYDRNGVIGSPTKRTR